MRYNSDRNGRPTGRYCTRACVELYQDGACGVVRKPAQLGALCEPWVMDLVEATDKLVVACEDVKIAAVLDDIEPARVLVELARRVAGPADEA